MMTKDWTTTETTTTNTNTVGMTAKEIGSGSTTTMSFLFILLLLPHVCLSNKDSNSGLYPFGQNPNENRRMYFPDAVSVLRNLDKFSSLHVRFHNCAWSPNTLSSFDDDGENYDGEDAWYQGRAAGGSAANAGFTLYGTLKKRLQFGGCRRSTYINSFFTDNGADVLVDALGLNGVDQSYTYCHQYENDNDDGNNQDSGDNQDDNNYPQSVTLGCTADGKFATALFTDQYCSGNSFWNTTDPSSSYNSYNKKLGQVHCRKIWNGKAAGNSDSVYKSVAHEILRQSEVCDTDVNALCPNPWGRKRSYETKLRLAGAGRRAVFEYRVRRPFIRLCHFLIILAFLLSLVAYRARNKERLQKEGWMECLLKDIPKWFRRRTRAMRKAFKVRERGQGDSRRRRSSRRKSKEYPEYGEDDERYDERDAGCGRIVVDESYDTRPSFELT